MNEQYTIAGYHITTDTEFQNEQFGITPQLQSQMEGLINESRDKKNKKIIGKLLQLIQQYPAVPQLKNYLSAAYEIQGNYNKARETTQWILAEHPGYLFGLLDQANFFINDKEYDKVPGILGKEMDLKALYPTRDLFYLGELTAFLKTAVRYYAAIADLELAENRFELLQDIAPDHYDTVLAESYLIPLRMEKFTAFMKQQRENAITPETTLATPDTGITEPPVFDHPEVEYLYDYGLDIPHKYLFEILEIPHYALAPDLEKVLDDAVARYHHFYQIGWEEETHTFPLHALFLLNEIHATNSLPKIFSFLSYNSDFLDFWIGDHLTETIWQCMYGLGIYKIPELKDFLKKPAIHTYCKTAVTEALVQISMHHPDRRGEIIDVFSDVMDYFSEAVPEDNLIDSDFNGLMICDIIDAELQELIPGIKKLFDKGYVAEGCCGSFDKVEEALKHPSETDHKRKMRNIFELYKHIVDTWSGYNEDDNIDDEDEDEDYPVEEKFVREEPKTGRNDPCPCGSGKKYKKCCMK